MIHSFSHLLSLFILHLSLSSVCIFPSFPLSRLYFSLFLSHFSVSFLSLSSFHFSLIYSLYSSFISFSSSLFSAFISPSFSVFNFLFTSLSFYVSLIFPSLSFPLFLSLVVTSLYSSLFLVFNFFSSVFASVSSPLSRLHFSLFPSFQSFISLSSVFTFLSYPISGLHFCLFSIFISPSPVFTFLSSPRSRLNFSLRLSFQSSLLSHPLFLVFPFLSLSSLFISLSPVIRFSVIPSLSSLHYSLVSSFSHLHFSLSLTPLLLYLIYFSL